MSKDYRVNTFGLTDEENTLVEESLPTRAYELYIADTPTDVIAIGCDAMIVNAAALDQDSADMIFDLYSQVDGCTNETVIWLEEPKPPKELRKFFKCYDSFDAIKDKLKYLLLTAHSKPFHYFVCTNYRQHGPRHCDCTSHYIRYDTLYAYVLSRLQYWSAQYDMGEEHLKRQLLHANDREQQRMVKMRDEELKRAQKRQKELDRLFSKLYEDWAAERITEYNFKVLSEKYQTEQAEVLEKIERLQAELATEQQTVVNIDQWIGLIQQYAHPEELTAEMLNALIEKIVVHEKTVGADGEKEQTVDIFYRFVGKID